MAKTPLGGSFGPRRGVSIRGRFYTVDTPQGTIIKRWPRPQPTARTEGEAANRKTLAQAARATAYMSAGSQEFAREIARRSKLLPRDMLLIALFNRLGYVVLKDGRKIYAMVAMQDVSNLLDAIGQVEGDLLVRGEDWWVRLPKGANGTVLGINEDGEFEWVTVGGGGGGGFFTGMAGEPDYSGGNTTSAFATKGWVGTPLSDMTITAMGWFVDQAGSSDAYRGVIADANPATGAIGSNIYLTPTHSSGSTDSRAIRTAFSTPVDLIAGQSYFFGIQITSGGGTTAARVSAAGNGYYPLAPIVTDLGLVTFNKNSLATGDTPSGFIDTEPQTIWYFVFPEGSTS